jgi:hypothetical protein
MNAQNISYHLRLCGQGEMCQELSHIVLGYAKQENSLEERRNENQRRLKICVVVT